VRFLLFRVWRRREAICAMRQQSSIGGGFGLQGGSQRKQAWGIRQCLLSYFIHASNMGGGNTVEVGGGAALMAGTNLPRPYCGLQHEH
jgi:hypothetical protein